MKFFTALFTAFSSFFAGVCINDVNSVKTKVYNFKTLKIKKDLRICLLADLHGKDFGNHNKKLQDAIDKANPDIIVMAGDIISAKFVLKKDASIELCRNLCKKYPVYYGIGNHEKCLEEEPEKFGYSLKELTKSLTEAGVIVLDNSKINIPLYNLNISGLNLPRKFFKRSKCGELVDKGITEYIGNADKDAFELLIGHSPEYFDIYANHGADLSVSGHLHGGVMGLPGGKGFISPKFRFFPKYAGGFYKMGKSRMVVSRGLGMHTIPIRIFNPSELVVINLLKK